MWLTGLFFLLLSVPQASTAPTVSFPINAQLPPVARVGQLFSFTFPTNTFTSSTTNLSYDMDSNPSWLQFDSTTRTFSGTPLKSDVGSSVFRLIASDDTGSIDFPVSFIVSDTAGPQVVSSIDTTIYSDGTKSGPSSFSFLPDHTITIQLNTSIFTDTGSDTQYYAVCSDNVPLPAWLMFHPEDLSFSGHTPGSTSPTQLPQIFLINVIATDVPGYSSAVFKLQISIDIHQLAFTDLEIEFRVTQGQDVNIDLKNKLTIDSRSIEANQIADVQTNLPQWLKLDARDLVLSGTPPKDATSDSFSLKIKDTYGDEANATILLTTDKAESLLSVSIPLITVYPGAQFSYALPPEMFLADGLDISLDLSNCSTWLTFDQQSRTLSGSPPTDLSFETRYINLTASKGPQSNWEEIPLVVARSATDTPNPTTTSIETTKPTKSAPSNSPASPSQEENAHQTVYTVPLIITIIGLGILLLAVTFGLILRRPKWLFRCFPFLIHLSPLNHPRESHEDTRDEDEVRRPSMTQIRRLSAYPYTWEARPVWDGTQVYMDQNMSPETVHTTITKPIRRKSAKVDALGSPSAARSSGKRNNVARLASINGVIAGHGSEAIVTLGVCGPRKDCTAMSPLSVAHPRFAKLAHASRAMEPSVLVRKHEGRTVRHVPPSPRPSEIPSPDLNSSPRAQLQAFVHDRATERKTSGFFSSAPGQRVQERDIMEMHQLAPAIPPRASRRFPVLGPPNFGPVPRRVARFGVGPSAGISKQSNGQDPFTDFISSSTTSSAAPSSITGGDWVDDLLSEIGSKGSRHGDSHHK